MAQTKRREQIQTNQSQYPQTSLCAGPHTSLLPQPSLAKPLCQFSAASSIQRRCLGSLCFFFVPIIITIIRGEEESRLDWSDYSHSPPLQSL